jgi:hypothetical protein
MWQTRRFTVEVTTGPPDEPATDVQLDAYVETGAPDPHPRSELDGRHPVGFGGTP